jgi:Putative O-methyltransferase
MSPNSYFGRPAKAIQRFMLIDACQRLAAFAPLSTYQYIGFGSHEFIDFDLAWRRLGITSLISIEETLPPDRYLFNAPYGGVRVEPGNAATVLPNLAITSRAIVWLDYTGKLDAQVIADVNGLARRLVSGSLLVVTINAHPEEVVAKRRESAVRRLGGSRIGSQVGDSDFAKWGLAEISQRILTGEVAREVRDRADGVAFNQLFRFHYQDTTRMLTWGGVFVGPADLVPLANANFATLPFVSVAGAPPFLINPPNLTVRELVRLNRELPNATGAASPLGWISDNEFADYARLHRWYPGLSSQK